MEALYRCLLRLYPAAVREEFGDEMFAVARQAWADACRKSMVARGAFWARELMGLLAGAVQEQVRAEAGFDVWPARRFTVRSNFRYPVATIVLMALIFAGTILAIEKATSISRSLPRAYPGALPPIVPLPYSLPQTLALMFAVTYAIAIVVWAIMFALRRAGVHRLNDAQTWPRK